MQSTGLVGEEPGIVIDGLKIFSMMTERVHDRSKADFGPLKGKVSVSRHRLAYIVLKCGRAGIHGVMNSENACG